MRHRLDAFIAKIRKDYSDPELKVDIIAHSMGGMITRYYARYGVLDVLDDNEFPVNQDGAKKIRRVILLGTPNLGSIGALRTLIRGFKVGLGVVPPDVTATFPSTCQVLPHAINDWFMTMDGRPLQRDQFSAENFWKRFRFSVYGEGVKQSIRDRFEDEDWELRLTPEEIVNPLPGIDYEELMLEPGDGRVTKASLLARQSVDPTVARHRYSFFPVDYPVFLCERHTKLTSNIDFQNNLLHALLSVDR
jgi:pimeloyl-ACP methyl ester carboxylesterase